ncbi:hypothetical protein DPV78_005110, partial [Talaromyces pinophilus]
IIYLFQYKHKLKYISITLPSTFSDSQATSKARNMIFTAYLYNGIVGNSTIKGPANTNESQASTATSRGYIIGLILIASVIHPFWRVNNDTGYTELVIPPRELFYHDLPPEEADY